MSIIYISCFFTCYQVRLQTMPIPGPNEVPLYSGTWDCAKKTITKEGFRGFYKGGCVYIKSRTYYFFNLVFIFYSQYFF